MRAALQKNTYAVRRLARRKAPFFVQHALSKSPRTSGVVYKEETRPPCTRPPALSAQLNLACYPRRGWLRVKGRGRAPTRDPPGHTILCVPLHTLLCTYIDTTWTLDALHTTISTRTALQQRAVALASAAQGGCGGSRRHEAVRVWRRRRREGGGEAAEEAGPAV